MQIALFLDPTAVETPGAAETLSRHLGVAGHDVDVVSRQEPSLGLEIVRREASVRHVTLAAESREPGKAVLAARTRDAFLRFMIADGARYDLLHGSSWLSGWIAVDLAERLELPATVTLTGACLRPPVAGTSEQSPGMCRDVVRRAHRLIVPTLRAYVALIERYGAPPERVEVVSPGVDVDQFCPMDRNQARESLGISPGSLVATYIGPTLHDADGASVDAAVRLAGELMGTPITLLLLDEAATRDRHLRYAASDVVVAVTRHESAEERTLEAMACARPVIGSVVDETTLALGEGVTGYLVPPREPEELAERLEQVLTHCRLRARMGEAARSLVEREYSWPVVARRLAALYERVLPVAELRPLRTEMLM